MNWKQRVLRELLELEVSSRELIPMFYFWKYTLWLFFGFWIAFVNIFFTIKIVITVKFKCIFVSIPKTACMFRFSFDIKFDFWMLRLQRPISKFFINWACIIRFHRIIILFICIKNFDGSRWFAWIFWFKITVFRR